MVTRFLIVDDNEQNPYMLRVRLEDARLTPVADDPLLEETEVTPET